MLLAAAFGLALLLSLALTPAGIRLAWATGYLDHPAARKLHISATALLGGAAVFVSGLAAWGALHLLRQGGSTREALCLLAGALLVFLLATSLCGAGLLAWRWRSFAAANNTGRYSGRQPAITALAAAR